MTTPQRSHSRLLDLALLLLVPLAHGAIGSDGLCPLFVFVPFTIKNELSTGTLTGRHENITSQGFSHMSAALLAIEHFNSRNASVVPELANASFKSCSVRFDTNLSRILDSSVVTHLASQSLLEQEILPCAIAGPFNDLPAEDLSVLALSARIPLVAHRAYNVRVASDYYSPYSSLVYPTVAASAKKLVDFLQYRGRTNYIGLIYSLTIVGTQRREVLTVHMTELEMEYVTSSYANENDKGESYTGQQTAFAAVKEIKESGFRTIVVAMEFALAELQPLADAAEELGMNNGDHFWVWFDNFELSEELLKNSNVTKLINGSAWLLPLSYALLDPEGKSDPFAMAWKTQGKEAVNRLNAANPIKPGETGFFFADDDWFQINTIEFGSAYLYDAVMSVGIGACLAEQEAGGAVSSAQHQKHIRKAVFTGATGPVAFGSGTNVATDIQNGRLNSTQTFGILNILPHESDREAIRLDPTEMNSPRTGNEWEKTNTTFVYRDGRMVPPELLRDEPEQNYLNSGLRDLGFALMGTALLCSIICAAWVYVRRKHRVLRASQPPLLYLIAFGAAVQTSTIVTISNDESYGWSTTALSRSCIASTWLLPFGTIIVYSSLFTKLWRVNKVLQFSRRKVLIRHVAGPMLAVVLATLLVLGLWSGLDPLWWERLEINDVTGESIGQCTCASFAAFLIPLVILVGAAAVATAFMAWKTIDVDDQYAESKWIFILILLQLEVLIIAVPLVIILRDVSSSGRYLGFTIMLWIFPMSTLSLIFLPKLFAYRRAIRGVEEGSSHKKRGEHSGVIVTGTNIEPRRSSNPSSSIFEENNGQQPRRSSNPSSSIFEENNGQQEAQASNDVEPVASHSKECSDSPAVGGE